MVGNEIIAILSQLPEKWVAFLRGSSLHPKELLGEFASHFLILSLSMAVPPDHIAKLLLFLSDAPLVWFTVNTSYDHLLHLSRQFGLSPRDYECLGKIHSRADSANWQSWSSKMDWRRFGVCKICSRLSRNASSYPDAIGTIKKGGIHILLGLDINDPGQ
jgi:hypothetical protein